MKLKLCFSIILFCFSNSYLSSQPRQELVKVIVAPDQSDWTYEMGEQAEFSFTVLRNNIPLENIELKYTIQPDPGYRSTEIWDQGTLVMEDKATRVKAKAFDQPGFLRCTATVEVDGK